MPVRYYQDETNKYLVYENTRTGEQVHVSDDDLEAAVQVCEDWHGSKSSPTARFIANDFSYRNLRATLDELRRVQQMADAVGDDDTDEDGIDGDDYLDLLTTIEDLQGIVARIEKIA